MSIRAIGAFFICLFISLSGWAATFTSTGTGGNWNAPGSWTANLSFPGAGDDVIIVSGATISVTANAASLTLTLNGTAILDFPGTAGTITLTVNGLMTMNGTSKVTGASNNRILALQNDFIVPASQIGTIGGVRITQPTARSFTVSGTFVPSSTTGSKNVGSLIMSQGGNWAASSTETYNFQGNGTFIDGCLISGSSTASINILGNLTVNSSVAGLHSKIGQITLAISGTTTISGYLEFANSNAGGKTFNNTITVNPGGTWDDTIGEDPVINCSIINNGSWPDPTGGTGQYSVNVAGTYNYSGNNPIGFTILRINSASTVTNNTTLDLISNQTGANAALRLLNNGNFINGATATLNFTQSADPVQVNGIISVADFSQGNNIVNYSSTGSQNIYTNGTSAYAKLNCSNAGTKFVVGQTTVTGQLTIATGVTVDVSGGSDLLGAGSLIMATSSILRLSSSGIVPAMTGTPTLGAGSTIEFYRGGTQTAVSSATYPYQNILISGAGGSNVNLSAVTNVVGTFTVINSGLFNSNAAMTVGGLFTYSSVSATASTLSNDITVGSFFGSSGLMDCTTNNKKIIVAGNNSYWQNNGLTFSSTGANASFGDGTGMTITGTTTSIFSTLTINNTTGNVALNGANITINTALNFTAGKLTTDLTHFVSASSSATQNAAAGTGWVFGNFRRLVDTTTPPVLTFPVGTSVNFVPISLTLTGVTNTTGSLTVSATDGDSPDVFSALFDANHTVNRYWTVNNSTVAFTSIAGTINFLPGDIDSGFNFAVAALKGYNLSTATWADLINPIVTYTSTTVSFTGVPSTLFPSTQNVNLQLGQTYTVQTIVNRRTEGTYLWSALSTWFQYRTGGLTFNGTTTVTGTSTKFLTELAVNDIIMLTTDVNTTYTVASVDTDTQIHISATPSALLTPSPVQFGRQTVPSSLDAVTIGSTLTPLTNTTGTTISLDGNFSVGTLDINLASGALAQAQVLQHLGTNSLTVVNATVNQPGGSVTDAWNIDAGSAIVSGDLTIGSTATTTTSRIAKVNLNASGSITTNNLKFKTGSNTNCELQAVLAMTSPLNKLTLTGSVTYAPNNRGSLTPDPGSTFIYKRTSGSQAFAFPTGNSTASRFAYGNVWIENTSSGGVALSTTITTATVLGNIEVHNGGRLILGSSAAITGNAGASFIVSPGGIFEMNTTVNPPFPTGYATFDMGTTAPFGNVYYNVNGSRPVAAVNFGNLYFMNNSSLALTATRTFTIPNSTITVFGGVTLGDGISAFTPILQGTGASSLLDVRGDINILGGTLAAGSLPTIKIGGNWVNNATFTPSTGTVEFSGLGTSATQTIGGTSASTFGGLNINTDVSTDIVQVTKDISVSSLAATSGGLDLVDAGNIGRTLTITTAAATAVTRTSGYIKNERIISAVSVPFGSVRWNISTTTGSYLFPFGRSSTQYVPFTLNKTTAGVGGAAYFTVSTYGTFNTQNKPLPSGVTNLNGAGDSNGSRVADRFWVITPTSYSTNPTADITFTIAAVEQVSGAPNINAQRWNSGSWNSAFPACGSGTCFSGSSPTQVTVMNVSSFSPWAVTDVATPLPISLRSFTATVQTNGVSLDWITESELNNALFTVQKTSDGEDFIDVAKMNGAGTTTETKHYTTMDDRPSAGIWYYRLKQTDFDGNFTYSKLVMVDVPENLSWIVYPNPSNGSSLNIQFSEKDLGKTAYVKIQDIGGKEVMLTSVNLTSADLQIATPQAMSPGVYIVSIIVDQVVVRQKLVVR